MYHHPTMVTYADTLTRAEKERDARRNLIADLESIHTDLEAAKSTARFIGDDDLADDIEALRERVAERLARFP